MQHKEGALILVLCTIRVDRNSVGKDVWHLLLRYGQLALRAKVLVKLSPVLISIGENLQFLISNIVGHPCLQGVYVKQ